jgi:molybdopterin-biosynthesis enzyme MoeA-like protein
MLAAYYGGRAAPEEVIERNLRMADVPSGVTLLFGPDLRWPVLLMRNVYILPGIPEIFRRKFAAIKERFRDEPFYLRQLFVRSEEGEIARHLDQIASAYPQVALGSYPRMEPADDGHRVKLTLESKDRCAVDKAVTELAALLGEETITRRTE